MELASWTLGLRSFLLGDLPSSSPANVPIVDQNDNVLPLLLEAAPEHAQDNQAAPVLLPAPALAPIPTAMVSSQPFVEPSFFRLRLCGLCVFTCLSLTILSILGLTIPAAIGRGLLGLVTGSARLHELYTILTGLYILWLITRIISFIRSLLPFDIQNILTRLKTYSILCMRVLLCTFLLIGYVPFMIGLASELGKRHWMRISSDKECFFSSLDYSSEYIDWTNGSSDTVACLDHWTIEYEDCHRWESTASQSLDYR